MPKIFYEEHRMKVFILLIAGRIAETLKASEVDCQCDTA